MLNLFFTKWNGNAGQVVILSIFVPWKVDLYILQLLQMLKQKGEQNIPYLSYEKDSSNFETNTCIPD